MKLFTFLFSGCCPIRVTLIDTHSRHSLLSGRIWFCQHTHTQTRTSRRNRQRDLLPNYYLVLITQDWIQLNWTTRHTSGTQRHCLLSPATSSCFVPRSKTSCFLVLTTVDVVLCLNDLRTQLIVLANTAKGEVCRLVGGQKLALNWLQ